MESPTEATFSHLVPVDSQAFADMFGINLSSMPTLWKKLVEHCPSFINEDAQPVHLLFALGKIRMDLPNSAIAMMFGKSEAEVSKYMWHFIKAIEHLGGRMVCGTQLSCVLHALHQLQFTHSPRHFLRVVAPSDA